MKVIWTPNAELSFTKELEFIDKKWSSNEVLNFIDLVDNFLLKLEKGIIQGKISKSSNIYSFVISKQTTIYFDVLKEFNTIQILLFWNNTQDPNKLVKYIRNNL